MRKQLSDQDLSSELEELRLIRHSIKEYQKGAYLFQEGDPIKGVYIVQAGKVQIGSPS